MIFIKHYMSFFYLILKQNEHRMKDTRQYIYILVVCWFSNEWKLRHIIINNSNDIFFYNSLIYIVMCERAAKRCTINKHFPQKQNTPKYIQVYI